MTRITALTVPVVAEDPLAPSATGATPTTHDAIKEPLLGVTSF